MFRESSRLGYDIGNLLLISLILNLLKIYTYLATIEECYLCFDCLRTETVCEWGNYVQFSRSTATFLL